MSFLRGLNRKQRRQFNKLEKDEKMQLLSHEMSEKYREMLNKEVAKSFIDGILFESKLLYDRYLNDYFNEEDQTKKDELVQKMIENVRSDYEKYLIRIGEAKKEKQENESEET